MHAYTFHQSLFAFVTPETINPPYLDMPPGLGGAHFQGTNLTLECVVHASRLALDYIEGPVWVGDPVCVKVHSV